MLPNRRLALIFALLALHSGIASATPDARAQQEIAALLAFVGQSHCSFIRNGKSYGADQAQSHLADKFHYLQRMGKVNTAEEFIDRAGTQSSLSGQPYLVICDGRQQTSAAWLKEELQRLRQNAP